jgi:hypothetical protein
MGFGVEFGESSSARRRGTSLRSGSSRLFEIVTACCQYTTTFPWIYVVTSDVVRGTHDD